MGGWNDRVRAKTTKKQVEGGVRGSEGRGGRQVDDYWGGTGFGENFRANEVNRYVIAKGSGHTPFQAGRSSLFLYSVRVNRCSLARHKPLELLEFWRGVRFRCYLYLVNFIK